MIDVTWAEPEHLAYFGVAFPIEQVAAAMKNGPGRLLDVGDLVLRGPSDMG